MSIESRTQSHKCGGVHLFLQWKMKLLLVLFPLALVGQTQSIWVVPHGGAQADGNHWDLTVNPPPTPDLRQVTCGTAAECST